MFDMITWSITLLDNILCNMKENLSIVYNTCPDFIL